MVRYSSPSLVTIMGLSVTRGRLPGAPWFAWPGVTTNESARIESGMPVSPAITDGSHAPLGVAENPLPQWSITSTQVVSFASPLPDPPVAGADAPRFPGRLSIDA